MVEVVQVYASQKVDYINLKTFSKKLKARIKVLKNFTSSSMPSSRRAAAETSWVPVGDGGKLMFSYIHNAEKTLHPLAHLRDVAKANKINFLEFFVFVSSSAKRHLDFLCALSG